MGAIPHQRIAQRHPVRTTPVMWKVARRGRRGPTGKLVLAEAAVVDVSIMGAGIVAPSKWEAPVGVRVEVHWEGIAGLVIPRRATRYPGSDTLVLYGVEYAENGSLLGRSLFERLVAPARQNPAAAPPPEPDPAPAPSVERIPPPPMRWGVGR